MTAEQWLAQHRAAVQRLAPLAKAFQRRREAASRRCLAFTDWRARQDRLDELLGRTHLSAADRATLAHHLERQNYTTFNHLIMSIYYDQVADEVFQEHARDDNL